MNCDACPSRFDALAGLGDPPTGGDLVAARLAAGLSQRDAARWLGRHRTSLARMERGHSQPSRGLVRLLAILGGVVPWSAWRGWTVRGGRLCAPHDGRASFSPGDLERVGYAWQLAAEARRQLRRTGVPESEVRRRLPQYGERDAA